MSWKVLQNAIFFDELVVLNRSCFCTANQLTYFYMRAALALNWLKAV